MDQAIDIISTGTFLHVKVSGKLAKVAYETFAPLVDQAILKYGKLRILFEMHDFHGWTAGALWEDIKFDFKHGKDIERLALVGEAKWEEAMAVCCKPFTSARIQYFDHAKLDDAICWMAED
jgi:hypothetical protein